jgi:hypothetical protein
MLDVLMPVSVKDIPLALTESKALDAKGVEMVSYVGAIPCLEEMTDVPFRLVVCVDGGTREDVELLAAYLPNATCEWVLMQNDGVLGYAYTLNELSKTVRNEFVAVVPPNIWVQDRVWFGKFQVVFTKDPHCFMVSGDVANTISATVPPFKLDHKKHSGSPFFLSRRTAMSNVGSFESAVDFSRKAHQLGGTRWVAAGVRYGDAHASESSGALEPAQDRNS